MASTQDLLNKVLVGLRQTQITSTSTTDAYELLLLQFINEAKEEVEESWDWHALRVNVTVTLAQGTSDYTLTSAGDADADTTERSKLLYERTPSFGGGESTSRTFGDQPQVFDTTDTTEYRLAQVGIERIERMHLEDNDEQNQPSSFALYSDGTSLKLRVYPTPEKARTLVIRLVNPQAELPATNLSTTTLTVPSRPVWSRALWKANEERGEEIARPNGPNQMAAQDALAAAISREQTENDITGYPQ
jgi:hypothetical protein